VLVHVCVLLRAVVVPYHLEQLRLILRHERDVLASIYPPCSRGQGVEADEGGTERERERGDGEAQPNKRNSASFTDASSLSEVLDGTY
jgi:hypothetical protein